MLNAFFPHMHSVLVFVLLSCFASTCHTCNQLDKQALLSHSNISSSSSTPLNWSSSIDCCLWDGITCDLHGRVTKLWLPFRGLRGSLSPSLANLSHLSHLNLSHNLLSGPLPNGLLSSFNHLTTLDLSFNCFSKELLSLPYSIQLADLSSNCLSGKIQPSLVFGQARAPNLMYFNVSNNSFTGLFPLPSCNSFSLIKSLDFSVNSFILKIPPGLGACSKLEVFRAGFNLLSGLLPFDIYNVTTLREMSLPRNQLSGPIGDGIVQLSNLNTFELYSNELNGEIPRDIGRLSSLEHLLLQSNSLRGNLPPSLMQCANLTTINIRNNFLEGDISAFDFSGLQKLRTLDLGNNSLTGYLPLSLTSCMSLMTIRLDTNELEGQVLPDMVAMQYLSFLSLSANRLINITGAIRILTSCKNLSVAILGNNFIGEAMPDDGSILGSDGFQKLQVLGLGGCKLYGRVPAWIAKLRMLKVLDLSFNHLTGSIPSWFGNLPRLFDLDLSSNFFSGEFPQELCRLPTLSSKLDVPLVDIFMQPFNDYRLQYSGLTNALPQINLRNNSLSGRIPLEIGKLILLHVLDLSLNNFSGSIPEQISNIRILEKLDLSNNHLSGEIPESLTSLHFLSSFSVANNNLQGQIPIGGQFGTFSSQSYEGNPQLCGSVLSSSCPSINRGNEQKIIQEEGGGFNIPWFHVAVGLGYATGFLVVCVTLLFQDSWRYAYFKFLSNMYDKVYVIVAVNMARLRRRLQR
ncbi:LOW QUALITY PROTEIN: receptor-like protein 2 [Actinidia eriantha]|uniref:LOW QUALITY PROTEIN: receptor-like protein 2 n=1 Tax=Actinidia eriantha TaxID=165200 RepID=UPI00258C6543|nr:LOW QUALITY PROTEIN: receptor-like protein 2 [Actinidia eriantha]